jgi:hypothetical protein
MTNLMKWEWKVAGRHTHVRVFFNGANCGSLVFRNEEFYDLRHSVRDIIFVDCNPTVEKGEPLG